MKLNKLWIAGAALLALTACNKNNDVEVPGEGDTYASVTVGIKNPSMRATGISDGKNFSGTDAEKDVKKLSFYKGTDAVKTFTAGTDLTKVGDGTWRTEPWEVGELELAEAADVAIALNYSEAVTIANEKGTDAAQYATIDDITTAASSTTGFIMSSTDGTQGIHNITIQPKIGEADVKKGAENETAKNNFSFNVQRAVAKVAITTAADDETNITVTQEDGTGTIGAFKNATFAVTNNSAKSFLFQKKSSGALIDAYKMPATAKPSDPGVKENYKRLGDYGKDAVGPTAPAHPLKAVNLNKQGTDPYAEATLNGYNANYVFENIEDQLFWGNITYAKVYGTFVPTTIYKLNAEENGLEEATDYTEGATFYVGALDHKFYTTSDAAKLSTTKPGQKSYKYNKGKVGYRVAVHAGDNADTPSDYQTGISDGVKNADVIRNRFYIINIAAINGLGFNYDGNDPSDPNLPKPGVDPGENPDNPDEPEDPIDGVDEDTPLNSTKTYMRVTAKILPWAVQGRDVKLKM